MRTVVLLLLASLSLIIHKVVCSMMLLRTLTHPLSRPVFRLLSTSKIPLPQHPTMAESFGTKFTKQELKIIMDPRGYLDGEEKAEAEQMETKADETSTEPPKEEVPVEQTVKVEQAKPEEMSKEFGFKYNGPEPTRYGDWCLKGKCVDF